MSDEIKKPIFLTNSMQKFSLSSFIIIFISNIIEYYELTKLSKYSNIVVLIILIVFTAVCIIRLISYLKELKVYRQSLRK